jgi:hypothetical protein
MTLIFHASQAHGITACHIRMPVMYMTLFSYNSSMQLKVAL